MQVLLAGMLPVNACPCWAHTLLPHIANVAGTPIQNNLDEFFALTYFVNPDRWTVVCCAVHVWWRPFEFISVIFCAGRDLPTVSSENLRLQAFISTK